MMRTTKQISDELFDGMHELSVAVLGRAVPAPELYTILENLEGASRNLVEVLGRLAAGLERSVDEFEVYEDDGGGARARARLTAAVLRKAAEHAHQVSRHLDAAQYVASGQEHCGRVSRVGGV